MTIDLTRKLLNDGPYPLIAWKEARDEYAAFRAAHGATASASPLLTHPSDNAKFNKTEIPLYGLSLAQADSSGIVNSCRFSTPECRKGCVSYAGKGELASVQAGRIRKTLFLAEHTSAFLTLLVQELDKVWSVHHQKPTFRVRLNTFSDVPWEEVMIGSKPENAGSLFKMFPRMRFFDYTKWFSRGEDSNLGWYDWPGNYRLIMSASEKTDDETIINAVNEGINYAVVFDVKRGQPLPEFWKEIRVVDGDVGDDRWSDPKGVIVGLRAKGRMRNGNWNMKRKVS